jgi:hypothetical protein
MKGKRKMGVLSPTIVRALKEAGSYYGRLGGQAKTPAKKKAARANGKLGGRPRGSTKAA